MAYNNPLLYIYNSLTNKNIHPSLHISNFILSMSLLKLGFWLDLVIVINK